MNPRTVIFVVVAIAIAGGAAMMVKSYLTNQMAAMRASLPKPEQKPDAAEILVAKAGLPAGSIVKPDDLDWHPWPEENIANVYAQKGKRQKDDFVGAVVRVGIAAGEPITDGRVVKPGDRGFLAAALTPGTRAMTVSINATSGIAGFVFPGDRVDVILTHRVGGKGKRRVSETILENVRIVAVDQVTSDTVNQAKVRRTATLELTPKQVEFLTVALSMGKLSFSLRSLTKEEIERNMVEIEVDPNMPMRYEPAIRGHTFTSEAEVSRLFGGGDGQTHVMTVFRGKKAQTTRLRSTLQ